MYEELKKHIEELYPINESDFRLIKEYFTPLSLKKNQLLIIPGQKVDKEFWVKSGLIKSAYIDKEGKNHILQFAMSNWWITDYQSFILKRVGSLNLECIEDSEVLYISYADKEKICEQSHNLANFFRIKANNGYASLHERILTLLGDNAKERYLKLKSKYPSLLHRVPKKLIALYLGVTRETLSRITEK